MFPPVGTETLPSDYSGDIETHIPLLSLQGTNNWFRPPPKSSSPASSPPSSSRASVATSATSLTNYKTLLTPSATAVHSSLSSEAEIEWDRKYETLLMSLWSLVYFSTLLLGTLLLIWGCLGRRVWAKVVGGLFVGIHVLVCVGMVVVEAHFEEMDGEGMETEEEEAGEV